MLEKITGFNRSKRKQELGSQIALLGKITFITFLVFLFIDTPVFAEKNDELETVFHVYLDKEHIGKVENKAIVQEVVNEKMAVEQNHFEDVELTIGESISFIPEKVFNPTYNNDKVINLIEDTLTVKAHAIEMKIGNETVGYFSDEETARKVVKAYKANYVSEESLDKIEETKDVDQEDESSKINDREKATKLSVGESIIKDVKLSEEVSFSEKKVSPNQVLNIEKGVKLLEKGTLKEKVHNVGHGEVLGEIASMYELSTKKLLELNPSLEEDAVLQIDQEIKVTETKSLVDVIIIEEENLEEKVQYKTEVIESKEMYKGDEKVKQKGKNGLEEVQYLVEMTNGKVTNKDVIAKKVTKEPTEEIIIKGTKVIPSRGSGKLSWPAQGGYVSSRVGVRWGSMHKGIDIARPNNRSISAADHGVVVSAGWDGGYGNKIVINHNNGMRTVYAHLSSINVQAGQKIEKGTNIGVMGSTGNSTGVHLHFEVYLDGALKDPLSYF